MEQKTRNSGKPPKEKQERLNIVLSKSDKARLDRLVELLEADTYTDVTKDAFRLLEYLAKLAKSGEKFYTKSPDGEMVRVEFFKFID